MPSSGKLKRWLFYYVDSPTDQVTGGGRSVRNLILGLRDRGIHPVFVSQCKGGVATELEAEGVSVRIVPLPERLDVYDKKALDYSLRDKAWTVRALLRYNQRVHAVAREERVNGLWARGVRGVLQIGGVAWWDNIPLVWDIGVEQRPRGIISILHALGLFLADKVVNQAAVQHDIVFGRLLSAVCSSRLTTIQPGIARARIAELRKSAQPSNSGKQLINVASIHPRKNQMMILRAFEQVRLDHPTTQLDLVGSVKNEQYARTLRRFVERSGLDDSVRFLGWREDVPALLGQSAALVLSSHREGVPHVIREAMFAEVPVVATAVGGVPEAVKDGETGFLVSPSDTDELGECIDYLLSHLAERKRMGKQGLELARQRFSREEWLSKYAEVLHDLSHSLD